MRRTTKKAIINNTLRVIASPIILVVFILGKLGVLKAIKNKATKVLDARANTRRRHREDLISRTTANLHCKNIDTYPSFWLGDTCMGAYSNGSIKLSAKAQGVNLVETMFHEDRHFQQEQTNPNCFKGYIKAEDDYRGYIRQHVEKDARRYAYVHTMRYAKARFGIRFYLFAPMYRLHSHPWKNLTLKQYR